MAVLQAPQLQAALPPGAESCLNVKVSFLREAKGVFVHITLGV